MERTYLIKNEEHRGLTAEEMEKEWEYRSQFVDLDQVNEWAEELYEKKDLPTSEAEAEIWDLWRSIIGAKTLKEV